MKVEWHKAILEIDLGEGEDDLEAKIIKALKTKGKQWARLPACRVRIVPLSDAPEPQDAPEGEA